MKYLFLFLLLLVQNLSSTAQVKKSKLSLEINYGLNGNFFVRSYNETAPLPVNRFLKKDFIGSIGGFEVKYNLSERSSFGLGYAKSVNKREINYDNGVNASISYFNITHVNHFYQLFYETSLSKKSNNLKLQGGIFYLRMNQQEIDASLGGVSFEERDFEHNKLEEGGVFLGCHYLKKIDTKFHAGLRFRVYYLVSTSTLEAITLTPTLIYSF